MNSLLNMVLIYLETRPKIFPLQTNIKRQTHDSWGWLFRPKGSVNDALIRLFLYYRVLPNPNLLNLSKKKTTPSLYLTLSISYINNSPTQDFSTDLLICCWNIMLIIWRAVYMYIVVFVLVKVQSDGIVEGIFEESNGSKNNSLLGSYGQLGICHLRMLLNFNSIILIFQLF